ncbi:MAG: hypothetical protein IKL29_06005, partial [Bacteroidaceae bacterium]|nr:hypothetical protein [Bacteroidaceae bacterium]
MKRLEKTPQSANEVGAYILDIIGVVMSGTKDINIFADTNFAVFLNNGVELILLTIFFIRMYILQVRERKNVIYLYGP